MLDNDSTMVLDALKKIAGDDDTYKVIEADEIIEILPTPMSKLQLSSSIRDLRDRDYVKVKYFTPDEYCLLTVKRAEEMAHLVSDEVVSVATYQKPTERNDATPQNGVKGGFARAFWGALLGSFLGGGIVTIIMVLLYRFVF